MVCCPEVLGLWDAVRSSSWMLDAVEQLLCVLKGGQRRE